ncbi:hypothetical protein [Tenacibaculum sp. nBUS_03]|uniref:hypothetical protein n=1 Tax=Tenacibaculum sp. nBUS_03 TaxID=3395320 RepID=UPI003EB9F984
MLASTVYPIIQELSSEEKIKLIGLLNKDLQMVKNKKPKKMTEKEKMIQEMKLRFQSKLYPPK